LKVTCGIDWSEKHHDVALVDADGKLVARRRITDDVAGWKALLELFAGHDDTCDEQIPIAIETSRGLLVACLRATGRMVYAINPLAVARYRERHSVAPCQVRSHRCDDVGEHRTRLRRGGRPGSG
jgi:hypothetical protein